MSKKQESKMNIKAHETLAEHLAYARRNRSGGSEYKPKAVADGAKKPPAATGGSSEG